MTDFIQSIQTMPQAIVVAALVVGFCYALGRLL